MKTKLEDRVISHVLLRYSDRNAPQPGTIILHENVIKEYEAVWFGKFGKPAGRNTISILMDQMEDKIPTYLFLVRFASQKYIVHLGTIEAVQSDVPDIKLVPAYYSNRTHLVKTWFKLTNLIALQDKILSDLIGHSSKVPIRFSLTSSMAGLMMVNMPVNLDVLCFLSNRRGIAGLS